MTLEELSQSLPNGFHDAELMSFSVNLALRTAELDLELWVPEGETDELESYRRGRVYLSGLECLAIEPPHQNYPFSDPGPVSIDDGPGDPQRSGVTLPKTAGPHHWFFVSDWNAFILVAARDARLEWTGAKYVRTRSGEPTRP
jgi:hypothetical protein